jgi:RNA-directed DNA polymerase
VPYTEMEKKTQQNVNTETKLVLIAKRAEEEKQTKFISLMHLLNKEYLLNCYKLLKKRKAAGIDGRTIESYTQEEIEREIDMLINRLRTGTYKPQPVRRVHIAKDNGKLRALGIPTVMDKILQLGMTRILTNIFDTSFLPSSYGYRIAKDAHACLKEVNHTIMRQKVSYIIDADIQSFFDTIDHSVMMKCISQRIGDTKFKRLIWKILQSGVIGENGYEPTTEGTPQGGIISPILANIYLHYVLDLWLEKQEKKNLRGYVKLIRYADDFIIGVQYRSDAERLLNSIAMRLKQFGLKLSSEKTKILEFGRFANETREKQGKGKPETFTFLGFTHYCGKTRDGRFSVKVKTSKKKLNKAIIAMGSYLKEHRTQPLEELWETLAAKLRGHYNYYGVSGNFEGMHKFYWKTFRLAFKWLNRRSQRKSFTHEEYAKWNTCNPLPKPKISYAFYNTW